MKAKGLVIGICLADAVLLALCIFMYLRLDRSAPVISFGENRIVYTEGMDTSLLLDGITAIDDMDGDVSDTLLIEKISDTAKGDVLVTYAALDKSNNVAKASRIFPANMNPDNQDFYGAQETETIETIPSETETGTLDAGDENGNPDEGRTDGQGRDGAQENQDGGQPRQPEEEDNNAENNQDAKGADRDQANDSRENEAPVLRLSKDVLTVKAGAESVNWNDCIRSLSDDQDSRAQLFSNLVMEGQVDLHIPGEYPVTIYTKDSEGMESEKHTVTVKVEG